MFERFKDLVTNVVEHLRNYVLASLSNNVAGSSTSSQGCGIIYCRTRDDCDDISGKLAASGISSKAYHAGNDNH